MAFTIFQWPRNLLVFVPENIPGGIIWVYVIGDDPEMQQEAFINLLKDVALAEFALHIAGSADSHGVKY